MIWFRKATVFIALSVVCGCKGTGENSNSQNTVMKEKLAPIIQASELMQIRKTEDLVLIDARSNADGYAQNHLEGALHVDLNKQLSDIKDNPANGGRHPLPSTAHFSELLGNLGISKNSHVVVYDDRNGAIASSRFWWMLKSAGHEKVQVLNGGIKEADKVGFPMSSAIKEPKKVESYPIDNWNLPLTTIAEVEKISQNKDYLVIDVRANERYQGKTEPIDLIAGHIPGAVNVPFSTNLDENGLFLSPAELKEKYQKTLDGRPIENVTVHCGSGVTACHTLLAFAHAEMEMPKLYVGSWSEWSRNDKTIATED